MERKIGEIFEYNGEWYQCVEGETICSECDLRNIICQRDTSINNPFKECSGNYRTDKKNIIFKKLEKVGEPYMLEDKKFQKYKVFKTPYIYHKIDCSWQSFADPYYISLEIKQTKEDMEENKLNLKPFDIQKAREGKPVCTRDGRKARIICFDRVGDFPIVALTDDREYKEEGVNLYDINGKGSNECFDLMMLPEKKEGWVNVYKVGARLETGGNVHSTKDAAIKCIDSDKKHIATVKIEWEG